jgi:hypothetical protein
MFLEKQVKKVVRRRAAKTRPKDADAENFVTVDHY